jgi:hypothetical protein
VYRRTTREADLGALAPGLSEAISAHAASRQIVLSQTRVWVTHSENPPAEGFFGKLFGSRANSADPDTEHDTVLVLHPTHLLVATAGAKRGTSVLSLPLMQASVSRGNAIAARFAGAAMADDGLTVSGFPGEHGRPGTYFVGLGAEPAGAECARAVEAAIVAAKNGP